jgi:transposase-like protein
MYPIAWACVEVESYDSWYWFLSYLQKDIQINNHGEGWVIISDQQKGLIKAVSEIVPEAEHRMCARHIYANLKKLHRDKQFQKMFWCCVKSSDRTGFNYHRAKLAQKTPEGAKDMMKTSPEHWSRAFFKLHNNCDSVENNLCESFNNAIMRARFYPIITSMEGSNCEDSGKQDKVREMAWYNLSKYFLKVEAKHQEICYLPSVMEWERWF